jgi:flagellar assembly factor FliW
MTGIAATNPTGGRPSVESQVLGTIEVTDDQRYRFPEGLYGFPECRDFVLAAAPRDGLYWLQSTTYAALVFLLVDPFLYCSGFHIDFNDVDAGRLGTRDPGDILVLAIVTIPERHGEPCTVNLHAPLLFNVKARQAHQSIRTDDGFGIREPIQLS